MSVGVQGFRGTLSPCVSSSTPVDNHGMCQWAGEAEASPAFSFWTALLAAVSLALVGRVARLGWFGRGDLGSWPRGRRSWGGVQFLLDDRSEQVRYEGQSCQFVR